MRVLVFTTYYPRHDGDHSGRFVADLVDQLSDRGVEMDVVAPGDYNDYGLAYGNGIVANAKRRPIAAIRMLISMIRTTRQRAAGADLVHAHWLASALVARLSKSPWVITLHGTGTAGKFQDLELFRRYPKLTRWLLRPAGAVLCVSPQLAEAARGCGLTNVHFIPNGVSMPDEIGVEDDPPHVLFVGRLSPEKGVDVLAAATEGMPRVIIGEGSLGHLVPDARSFMSNELLQHEYARSAVLVLPSFREGLPVVLAEAMAHGRPAVASDVGGVSTLVRTGETGVLVTAGDIEATRAAVQMLLADEEQRRRLGSAARELIRGMCSWDAVLDATMERYRETVPGDEPLLGATNEHVSAGLPEVDIVGK